MQNKPHHLSVLILQNDTILRADLQDKLKRLGYGVVVISAHGEDGLAKAASGRSDLALVDISLAGSMDGIETARRLYELYDVPSVFLTADSDPVTLRKMNECSPFGYVLMPCTDAELSMHIQIAMQRHDAERALRISEARAADQHARSLQAMYDAAPFGMCQLDLDFRYVRINARLANMNGIPVDQHIGKSVADVVPAIAPIFQPIFRRVIETGEPVLDIEASGETRAEPGVPHTWLESWFPQKDEAGRVVAVNVVVQDITDRKRMETALREQESELRRVVDGTPFLLTRCDRHLCYRFVSRAYAKMLGRRAQDIIGRPIKEIMGASGFRTIAPYVADVLQGRRVDYEADIDFAGVGPRRLHVTYVPEQDAEGRTTGWIASILDVTEERAGERALRESEERFRSLVSIITDITWMTDANGQFIVPQPSWEAFTGQTWDEHRGSGWVTAVHPDDRERVYQIWKHACNTKTLYESRGRLWHAATQSWRYYIGRATPVLNEDGSVREWIGCNRDVDDAVRTSKALRASKRKLAREVAALQRLNELSSRLWIHKKLRDGLQDMLQATIDLLRADKGTVQIVDRDGTLSLVAQQGFDADCLEVFRQMSVEEGSWCDQTLRAGKRSVIEDVDTDSVFAPFREIARKAGYRAVQSTRLISRGGEVLGILWTHWTHPYCPSEADLHRLELYARQASDFIQRMRADEELERLVANRTKELIDSQAQLRALATELNLAEHRERKRLASELHDHLAQMLVLVRMKLGQAKHVSVSQMLEMIETAEGLLNDSLDYTRELVAQLCPPVLHEFGLPAALRWLGEQMQRYGLTVVTQIEIPDDVALAEDEAVLLFQSTRELLMNTVKHAFAQEAMLTMTQRDGCVDITVRDRGVGFEPSSLSTPATPKFGLFSIRERMQALGGHFEIDSIRHGGTTATLILPCPQRAEPIAAPRETAPQEVQLANMKRQAGVCRVLIVDDHTMLRQGLRSVLESYDDMEVVGEASNGQEAVDMALQLDPSVIVMDINMPLMNGVDATAKIKTRQPHITVIGLSVNTTSESTELMRAAGATVLIAKEEAVDHLHAAIRAATNATGPQAPAGSMNASSHR